MYTYIQIHIDIHIHIYLYVYVCMYIFLLAYVCKIQTGRGRERAERGVKKVREKESSSVGPSVRSFVCERVSEGEVNDRGG